jgi:hypothetical protein
MINHARTLLLNVSGPHLPSATIPGDEYIPEFEAADLPSQLGLVYATLFGEDPDCRGRVYRAAEYMKIIHASGYDSYVYDLDPRITYSTKNESPIVDGVADFRNTSHTAVVIGGREFGVTGTWADAGADGRLQHRWSITAVTATLVSITNMRTGVSYTTELTAVKTLPGSDLRLTTTVTALTPGKDWTVTYNARPQPSLGVITASLRTLPANVLFAIFGVATQEPFATFNNLFTQAPYMPQQLAGFLLALIYRLDAARGE